MTRLSINFILAYSQRLEEEKRDRNYDEEYITQTMLNGIYNVLRFEGYSKKYLDKFFFCEGYPNMHKEQTKKACKFYHYIFNRKNPSKVVEEFFNENPAGIKLRKEIDKLSEKFNQ